MATRLSPRDLAYSGLFGAAALLLPAIFHLVQLGRVFMPMYLPIVALGFFVRPPAAAITGVVVPLISGAVTGMPPFYPPVAVCMAVELGTMAGLIAAAKRRWPSSSDWLVLVPALVLGRLINWLMVYGFARIMSLPANFLAGTSLLSGWPGLILMISVVPFVAKAGRRLRTETVQEGNGRA